ncbi:ArsR/SmtB family transcription factor [Hutsoniella sourekii]|uniref:ArsR/SmtB family transcription factor n=1 Tax=Hutsoniella sourekii TaxID=87650 RepID=UPI0004BB4A7E|nr:metalloregulator ArsR/SmtB family transcription factor [Hutsoniella sourekii]
MNTDIEKMSRLFKVLSEPNRLKILFILKESEKSVTQICQEVEMEQSAVSHQLRILREARLVKSNRQGKLNIYQLDDDHVFSVLKLVHTHILEEE